MKTFLIIIGCILIYIMGFFVTYTMCLYINRSECGSPDAYDFFDESDIVFAFIWPLSIWFAGTYLIFLHLKKYAIAITEILYQINHDKENEDVERRNDD